MHRCAFHLLARLDSSGRLLAPRALGMMECREQGGRDVLFEWTGYRCFFWNRGLLTSLSPVAFPTPRLRPAPPVFEPLCARA